MAYIKRKVNKTYSAAGAIDINATQVFIGGGSATALTLAAPPATPMFDGHTMEITAITAQAHTVTFATVGFNGAGAAGDVATFTGAKGDSMTIIAQGGVWYTVGGLRNVTLA